MTDPQIKSHGKQEDAIAELGLEKYAYELDMNGLVVVPPEVTGLTEERVDMLVALLLRRAEELVGCPFTLEAGPTAELEFPSMPGLQAKAPKPSQTLVQMLASYDRSFRDLALNPVALALIRHMIGHDEHRHNVSAARRSTAGCDGRCGCG